MQLGGVGDEGCPELTCDIPDPATPGWKLETDEWGCQIWFVPPGPFACGTPPLPPIEAAPPCAPVSVESYVPAPMTPPSPPAAACSAGELSSFWSACLEQGLGSSACAAFAASDATCAACLVSQSTDATWGPVVKTPQATKLNVAGCMALVQGDASETSCAQRASDEIGCEAYACDGVCPVTPDAGESAYEACVQGAAAGGCHAYLDAECDAADAGVSACIATAEQESKFVALAAIFCGGS